MTMDEKPEELGNVGAEIVEQARREQSDPLCTGIKDAESASDPGPVFPQWDPALWSLYRKKPVVIRAREAIETEVIHTHEGDMTASPGDMVICGVKGEFYPCKPDIFSATYEVVEADAPLEQGATGELHPDLDQHEHPALLARVRSIVMNAGGGAGDEILARLRDLLRQ